MVSALNSLFLLMCSKDSATGIQCAASLVFLALCMLNLVFLLIHCFSNTHFIHSQYNIFLIQSVSKAADPSTINVRCFISSPIVSVTTNYKTASFQIRMGTVDWCPKLVNVAEIVTGRASITVNVYSGDNETCNIFPTTEKLSVL